MGLIHVHGCVHTEVHVHHLQSQMGSNPKHALAHGAECRKSCALCAGARGVAEGYHIPLTDMRQFSVQNFAHGRRLQQQGGHHPDDGGARGGTGRGPAAWKRGRGRGGVGRGAGRDGPEKSPHSCPAQCQRLRREHLSSHGSHEVGQLNFFWALHTPKFVPNPIRLRSPHTLHHSSLC